MKNKQGTPRWGQVSGTMFLALLHTFSLFSICLLREFDSVDPNRVSKIFYQRHLILRHWTFSNTPRKRINCFGRNKETTWPLGRTRFWNSRVRRGCEEVRLQRNRKSDERKTLEVRGQGKQGKFTIGQVKESEFYFGWSDKLLESCFGWSDVIYTLKIVYGNSREE